MGIGLSHSQEALQAATAGFAGDEGTLKYTLKALFCTCTEDHDTFDKCFQVFWGTRKHTYNHKIQNKNTSNVVKRSNNSLVMMGFKPQGAETPKEEEEAKNVSGASAVESLKFTDFSKVSAIDRQVLDELANKLLKQLNHRLKRKLESTKQGQIDIRKTIRNNMSNGDALIKLARRDRKMERYRIILLLDVSGSMDKYSFFLLKFIWSLKSNLKQIEAFVFSTKLVRITEFLRQDQLDETLFQMSQNADNWSSGTKIGKCFEDFNNLYAKRILNGKSITIVLSDGLDHGQPELLAQETQKIRLRTSKLVWLNPLKGTQGYEPTARGMQAALPSIDEFQSAHNLHSLLELENILANV